VGFEASYRWQPCVVCEQVVMQEDGSYRYVIHHLIEHQGGGQEGE
jgi:hypothetical protein